MMMMMMMMRARARERERWEKGGGERERERYTHTYMTNSTPVQSERILLNRSSRVPAVTISRQSEPLSPFSPACMCVRVRERKRKREKRERDKERVGERVVVYDIFIKNYILYTNCDIHHAT